MPISMTGFATGRGQAAGMNWQIDLRSVNGKGFDLRLRVPEWIEGLEVAVRAELAKRISRGNVSVTIKVTRDEAQAAAEEFHLNAAALDAALIALGQVEEAALRLGVTLAQGTATDVLSLRGVIAGAGAETQDTAALRDAILKDLGPVCIAFDDMRRTEGKALSGVLEGQLGQIDAQVAAAKIEAANRQAKQADQIRDGMARILQSLGPSIDEARLAQELAMLAVKSDVAEELDRLTAHIAAAKELLGLNQPVGRKLDFLTQEFVREANTLCSKAQSLSLTRIGLDLKTLIDQMREQIQNLE